MTGVKRWLRRLGIALLVLVACLTVASFSYNAATAGREADARSLYPGPYLDVDGTAIAYRRWGRRGSPIVLLGGFAEASWVWRSVGTLLGRRHRVFALDLPPFGYSQRRGPYDLTGWTALVRAFDARLGLRRPLLVGHSLGAAVVVASALARPRSVSGIVLLDGDALPVGGPRWLSHLFIDPYYTSAFRILTGWDWLVGRTVRDAHDPSAPKPTREEIEQWERPFRVRGTGGAFHRLFAGGANGVSTADLGRVRVPSTVVWGEHDRVDSVDAGRRTARLLRARFVLVRDAGHLSMLDRPGGVARAIERAAAR